MALRTIKNSADQKGRPVFLHFSNPSAEDIREGSLNLDLNRIMQNMGGEAFSYQSFKTAYDTDPRVKEMVKNFSESGIELKTQEDANGAATTSADGSNKVSQMAKSATNLGDTLS